MTAMMSFSQCGLGAPIGSNPLIAFPIYPMATSARIYTDTTTAWKS